MANAPATASINTTATPRQLGQFSAHEIPSEAFRDSLVRAVDNLFRTLNAQVLTVSVR